MTRTGNAPFDAYLRDPEPGPPPSTLSDRRFDTDDGAPSSSAMAHPFYNSGIKHVEASSFNYPYQHPYAQHAHHNSDDNTRSRNSSGSSSGRSAISPHVDVPQLTLSPNIFASGDGSTRNAGGSAHTGLQFQMPSFLGGISAVAPGGGGEVVNPTGLPLFPSFSVTGNGMSTMGPPMAHYAGWAPNSAQMLDPSEKMWLNKQPRHYSLDEEAPSPLPRPVAPQTRKPSMPFDFADAGPSSSSTSTSTSGFAHHEGRRTAQPNSRTPFTASDDSAMSPFIDRPSTSQSDSFARYPSNTASAGASAVQQTDLRAISLLESPITSTSTDVYSQSILEQPNSSHLPLYSLSGFNALPILSRVCNRPRPMISLGPIDMACAFVVADARQPDTPIVYASRTFCELTGYTEMEVIGKNCRFLQSPDGNTIRGEERKFTSSDAVRNMRFAVGSDVGPQSWRECQVSLINYRKDGQPFMNRVSIIPVPAEDSAPVSDNSDNPTGWEKEIGFVVGFQVDLNEQPSRIIERLRNGRYYPQYVNMADTGKAIGPSERCAKRMRNALREWICDSKIQAVLKLSTSCNASLVTKASSNSEGSQPTTSTLTAPHPHLPDPHDARQWLHMLLLEHMPDFVLVLSLKGHFLYIAPAVKRVLGYNSSDLLGRCISEFCHPSDSVPLLRELKESTISHNGPYMGQGYGLGIFGTVDATQGSATGMDSARMAVRGTSVEGMENLELELSANRVRTVDLLFRMRDNAGNFKWIECLGRLHVEPGKGRKAIVLSGRGCPLPNLDWNVVSSAGGLMAPTTTVRPATLEASMPMKRKRSDAEDEDEDQDDEGDDVAEVVHEEKEFWAILCDDGLVLVASAGVKDILGWGAGEMIGRSVRDILAEAVSGDHQNGAKDFFNAMKLVSTADDSRVTSLSCCLRTKGGESRRMEVVLYGPSVDAAQVAHGTQRFIIQCKTVLSEITVESDTTTPRSRAIIAIPRRASADHAHGPSRTSPDDDLEVFTELTPARATSWQYELQQLKFANRKLRRAVATLESNLSSPSTTVSTSSSGSSLVLHLDIPVEAPAGPSSSC